MCHNVITSHRCHIWAKKSPEKIIGYILESGSIELKFKFDETNGQILLKNGYYGEYFDKNERGYVDSGDSLHIWGRALSGNYELILRIALMLIQQSCSHAQRD